jgi:hypothetical protein
MIATIPSQIAAVVIIMIIVVMTALLNLAAAQPNFIIIKCPTPSC